MVTPEAAPIKEAGSGQPHSRSGSIDAGSKLARVLSVRSLLSYGDQEELSQDNGVPKRSQDVTELLETKITELGGDRAIHSVLVANNGLAAVKFMRSIRSWAYSTFGNERAVLLIAMATPEDMRAEAEHVRMADQFVEVPGGKNVGNYANVALIASVAARTRVDAVWPGWGHASEDPELPAALAETPRRAVFLGPPGPAMAALGDKVGSTILAQAAGVPTLPWSGSGVKIAYADCPGGVVPPEPYSAACVHSLADALESCGSIGYPVMLKASWGGGGKGIRKVLNDDEVRRVYGQVLGEVPGSPVFAMKLAPQSRHLEVQLLADSHGNVCSLFGRDCSVQRRHQKIVEEGPVTCADPSVVEDMERCARALARSVGYVGAATVEYLYLVESKTYCFLELNPRLQVEHPVTEWISNVNIPAAQLLIGSGVPLHRIPDIRKLFGRDPSGTDEIDFEDTSARSPPAGHVVAVRITAENANDGFKPTSGGIEELSFRSTPDVWGYFSVKGGGAVHEYADSQFGHLFAKGNTRDQAIRAMVVALKEIRIRGEIRTTIDYVLEMIQSVDFVSNLQHTAWLDARIAAQVRSERPPWHLCVACGAVLSALDRVHGRQAEWLEHVGKGAVPPRGASLTATREEFVVDGVKYDVRVSRRGPARFHLEMAGPGARAGGEADDLGGEPARRGVDVVARGLNDGGVLLQIDGASHVVHREEEALGTRLTIDLQTCLLSNEHDPSRLIAASPGKLLRFLIPDGGHVASDEPYAEVEVMKMVMTLLAPAAGTIHHAAVEGSALSGGTLIAGLDLDDPASVRRAEPFRGGFPLLGPPRPVADGIGQRYAAALQDALDLLAGFEADPGRVLNDLLRCLEDPMLPLVAWDEAYSGVASRLPKDLSADLEDIVAEGVEAVRARRAAATDETARSHRSTPASEVDAWEPAEPALQGIDEERAVEGSAPSSALVPSPLHASPEPASRACARLLARLDAAVGDAESAEASEAAALASLLDPLRDVAAAYAGGRRAAAASLASRILGEFLAVEEAFEVAGAGGTESDALDALRAQHQGSPGGLSAVLELVLARRAVATRAALVEAVLVRLVLPAPDAHRPALRRLAALTSPGTGEVAAAAQRTLERSLLGELRTLVARALLGLDMFEEHSLDGVEGDGVATAGRARAAARRATLAEGVYAGLGNLRDPSAGVEARMAMLAGAPAAVDDALASLLDSGDATVARRALVTYVRRLYSPGLLHDPAVAQLDAAGSPVPAAIWSYERVAPCPAATRARHGAALLLGASASLAAAARALGEARRGSPLGQLGGGTLHVLLTGPAPAGLVPASASAAEPGSLGEAAAAAGDVDPRAVEAELAARAGAALEGAAAELREAGYDAVCFLLQRGTAPPARLAFYARGSDAVAEEGEARPAGAPPHAPPGGLPPRPAHSRGASRATLPDVEAPNGWVLDEVLARVEPPTAEVLELGRLRGAASVSAAASRNRQWLIVQTRERRDARAPELRRAFLRGTVRALGRPALLAATYSRDPAAAAAAAVDEASATLAAAVEELTRTARAAGSSAPDWTSVFLSVLHPVPLGDGADEAAVAAALRGAAAAVAARGARGARRAALASWELRLRDASHPTRAWRIVYDAPTGHEAGEECVDVYVEEPGATPCDAPLHRGVPAPLGSPGPLDGQPLARRVPPLAALQQRRLAARRHDTTYAYDFPAIFEAAIRAAWAEHKDLGGGASAQAPSGRLAAAVELVPRFEPRAGTSLPSVTLEPCARPPGQNDVGIVAWVLTLKTPEAPAGRQVVAIANDITFASGAFGPREDAVFAAATQRALDSRLPIVYLAVNSGARVGLAQELKQCIRVKWSVEGEPLRGFEYLYLSDDDFSSLLERSRAAEREERLSSPTLSSASGGAAPAGSREAPFAEGRVETTTFARTRQRLLRTASGKVERVHELLDAFGLEDGLGVECLSGSGAIAGIYSRAFREGITITFTSGRAVGIGAYLARLGRRVVQRSTAPLVLTGYAALNKLLGREVYTSQAQLGGPRVMGANGVSHQVVRDDLEGVGAVLRWLSFVPAHVGGVAPLLRSGDPASRLVAYAPAAGEKMDARAAIAGRPAPSAAGDAAGSSASWQGGIFDHGSWVESQAGWARTVVTGRARLGGQPVGVIATEACTVTLSVPADPGQPDSSEKVVQQAGQVWYPDSALKTANAIEEFALEGLPLVVLANWRGFSGGQRDLYDGVLQAGSQIVEALRTYSHPVFVYLGPECELRGGAWVVLDSQINPEQIEMYADPAAQGAVLEPEGVAEIKFRRPDVLRMMQRLDPELAALRRRPGAEARAAAEAHERRLLPAYTGVALEFARMHDGAARMRAKGVVRGVVEWAHARAFLATRLRRRLAEAALARHVAAADDRVGAADALALVRSWYLASPGRDPSEDSEALELDGDVLSSEPSGTKLALPPPEEPVDELEAETQSLWLEDARFLSWAEGDGAARVALELRALRLAAAARAVGELATSAEGAEGLVRGVAAAIHNNPALKHLLAALIHE